MKKTAHEPTGLTTKIRAVLREEISEFHPRIIFVRFITAIIPPYAGIRIRRHILKLAGIDIGRGTIVMGTPHMHGFGNIRSRLHIGCDVVININCFFDLNAPITIGDHVALGHEVMLMTSSHHMGDGEHRAGQFTIAPVVIEDGAWIGSRSTILPGVTIGTGSVVAAGAMVTKNVPPHTLVGGVPACVIRAID